MRLVLATIMLAAALPVTAQIYQYTDAKGNLVYTDRPPLGADANSVELQTINSLPSSTNRATNRQSDTDNSDASDQAGPYSQLQLTGLPDAEALRANNGNFTVQVAIIPDLVSPHRLQLLVDGQAYGTASAATSIQVTNLARGEHRLAVQVLAGEQVLQRSDEQTLSVQRVHTGSPAFQPKPSPRPKP